MDGRSRIQRSRRGTDGTTTWGPASRRSPTGPGATGRPVWGRSPMTWRRPRPPGIAEPRTTTDAAKEATTGRRRREGQEGRRHENPQEAGPSEDGERPGGGEAPRAVRVWPDP